MSLKEFRYAETWIGSILALDLTAHITNKLKGCIILSEIIMVGKADGYFRGIYFCWLIVRPESASM
jgi:hypothetical protein